jgi:iron(III) transport system substrate-binding protein
MQKRNGETIAVKTKYPFLTFLLVMSLILSACASSAAAKQERLVVYSGRSESLVGPIIEQFTAASDIQVDVRWGSTSELAATLLEEGRNSPADVFYAQDPGGMGAVYDLLALLPDNIADSVDPSFKDENGRWVGVSGRARVIVYNTDLFDPADLPADIRGYTDPEWKGRIGWAPTNASFQTMVTAMRQTWGEEETRQWLEGIIANQPIEYDKNTSLVSGVAAGEVDIGFTNHYYLYRFLREEGEGFKARNYYLMDGGPGSLVMVSGAGVLNTSKNKDAAAKFIEFLLSPVAQQYFASQTSEYPVVEGVLAPPDLPAISDLNGTRISLAALADMKGTVDLLRRVGALP